MKKDLFTPSGVEGDIQIDVISILSSTPSRNKVKKLMPKIRAIEKKMRKKDAKKELRRLLQE